VSFTFRRGPESKYTRYGFVAQELERILPAVVRGQDSYKHVLYQDLIAVLALAIKEQSSEIQALRKDVAELQVQFHDLRAALRSLELERSQTLREGHGIRSGGGGEG
jgi:flagellar biosynthesis chaperone FliJ